MVEQNTYIQLIVSLFLVLAFIFGIYYMMRKLSKIQLYTSPNKYFKVVDRLTLGPDKYLAIVNFNDSYLLISVSNNSISLIKEYEELNKIEEMIESNQFKDIFVSKLNDYNIFSNKKRD